MVLSETELIHVKSSEVKETNDDSNPILIKNQSHRSEAVLSAYKHYLQLLNSCWLDAPHINLTFHNLSYTLPIKSDEIDNPNIAKAFKEMFIRRPLQAFPVLSNLTGHIQSGRLTLVLATSGGGKSSFLKLLAGQLQKLNSNFINGSLYYNGLTSEETAKNLKLSVNKLAGLVGQSDVHMANLTVRETLEFAFQNTVKDLTSFEQFHKNTELIEAHKHKVDSILNILDMTGCADTIVGNSMVRGISGGQKKRLTIAEAMITNARVLVLDEPTVGKQ